MRSSNLKCRCDLESIAASYPHFRNRADAHDVQLLPIASLYRYASHSLFHPLRPNRQDFGTFPEPRGAP
jgi:hypothetical protein